MLDASAAVRTRRVVAQHATPGPQHCAGRGVRLGYQVQLPIVDQHAEQAANEAGHGGVGADIVDASDEQLHVRLCRKRRSRWLHQLFSRVGPRLLRVVHQQVNAMLADSCMAVRSDGRVVFGALDLHLNHLAAGELGADVQLNVDYVMSAVECEYDRGAMRYVQLDEIVDVVVCIEYQ